MIYLNPALNRKVVIVGIVLAFALQIVGLTVPVIVYFYSAHSYSNFKTMFFVSRLFLWLCLFTMYLYSVKAEKQSFLFREEKRYPIGFYLLAVISLIAALFVLSFGLNIVYHVTGLYSDKSEKFLQTLQIFNNDRSLMLFTIITAGIMEELVFRGYLLSRLGLLFKNKYLPVIISSVLFGLIHFGYGTIPNIVTPIFIGVLFSLFYIRYNSMMVIIAAHFLYDLLIIQITIHYYFPN